jgi:membrane associated rhomboid family serine protease
LGENIVFMPPATRALILVNVVVFVLQQTANQTLILWFALWPPGAAAVFGPDVGFAPWQLVTYSFLHGGLAHIFFNMFALYMFGGEIERLFGSRWFLALYFVSVVAAGLAQLAVSALAHVAPSPTLGASGGVFGVLLAFGMYFPKRMIMLIFPPIPMPAWLFVSLYGLLELFLGVTGTEPNVAHFAHLGGMLGAYAVIRYRRAGPFPRRR